MRLNYSGKWARLRHPENWRELHESATIVDLHVHQLIKAAWFRRDVTINNEPRSPLGRLLDLDPFELDPFTVRTDFPKMRDGGIRVALATAYAFETDSLPDYNFRVGPFRKVRWKQIRPWARTFFPHIYRQYITAPPFESIQAMFDGLEKDVARLTDVSARIVQTSEELHSALAGEETIAVVRALEGGHSLEGPETRAIRTRYDDKSINQLDEADQQTIQRDILTNLETLAAGGLAYVSLAHFYPNAIATSAFPYPERIFAVLARDRFPWIWRDLTEGLTHIGHDIVRRMLELGICVDLCHTTPTVRKQVYDLAEASGRADLVLFSHAGVYERTGNPYNPFDWEIKWIAEHGGVVGVIFSNYVLAANEQMRLGLGAIAQTMAHLFNVGGEDVIAIGSDLDGFSNPPDDIPDISYIARLTQRLLVESFLSEDEATRHRQIKKILGQNALRVLSAALP